MSLPALEEHLQSEKNLTIKSLGAALHGSSAGHTAPKFRCELQRSRPLSCRPPSKPGRSCPRGSPFCRQASAGQEVMKECQVTQRRHEWRRRVPVLATRAFHLPLEIIIITVEFPSSKCMDEHWQTGLIAERGRGATRNFQNLEFFLKYAIIKTNMLS